MRRRSLKPCHILKKPVEVKKVSKGRPYRRSPRNSVTSFAADAAPNYYCRIFTVHVDFTLKPSHITNHHEPFQDGTTPIRWTHI